MPEGERDRGLGCEMTTGAALRRRRHGAEKTAPIVSYDEEGVWGGEKRREWVGQRLGGDSHDEGGVKYGLGWEDAESAAARMPSKPGRTGSGGTRDRAVDKVRRQTAREEGCDRASCVVCRVVRRRVRGKKEKCSGGTGSWEAAIAGMDREGSVVVAVEPRCLDSLSLTLQRCSAYVWRRR